VRQANLLELVERVSWVTDMGRVWAIVSTGCVWQGAWRFRRKPRQCNFRPLRLGTSYIVSCSKKKPTIFRKLYLLPSWCDRVYIGPAIESSSVCPTELSRCLANWSQEDRNRYSSWTMCSCLNTEGVIVHVTSFVGTVYSFVSCLVKLCHEPVQWNQRDALFIKFIEN
jgi:hypothetical protein